MTRPALSPERPRKSVRADVAFGMPAGMCQVVAGIRLAELRVEIGHVPAEKVNSLPQLPDLGGELIAPAGFGLPQFRPELPDLIRQLSDGGSPFRSGFGSGANEHSFTGLSRQHPGRTQAGDRSPHDRDGHAIVPGQLRGRGDGRADRKLTSADPPPEVLGDLLVRGAPEGFGHLAALPARVRAFTWRGTPTLADLTAAANHAYMAEHSVLACRGRLRTPVDRTRAPPSHLPAHRADPHLPARHVGGQAISPCTADRSGPGEQAAKHTRRGHTPNQEATPIMAVPVPAGHAGAGKPDTSGPGPIPGAEEKALYRIPEAMRLLSLSRSVIYNQIRAGRLRSVKQGSTRLIPAEAIADYVALLKAEAEGAR